jgi:hypothetical protein
MPASFPLAARPRLSAGKVGQEGEPVLLADGIAADPQALVGLAAAGEFAPVFGPAGGYPGLRAPAPLDYVRAVVSALAGPVGELFALGPVQASRAQCSFSIVTLPPDALVPAQRAPHVDTTDAWQFAVLHYLCDARFGGTAFYRHRATGFETLSPDRLPAYQAARAGEGWAPGYVEDGAPWFERTGAVDAAFNRLVVYRSRLLHSGQILAPEALSPDPRVGRLTANIFVTYRPAR